MDKFLETAELCRSSAEFRARLRAAPAAALAERGIAVAPGIDFRLVENSAGVYHVVLPPELLAAIRPDAGAEIWKSVHLPRV